MNGNRHGEARSDAAILRRKPALLLLALSLIAAAPADPDWPCVQRLVPKLTAATLWAGPTPEHDWHADPKLSALADQLADRRTPIDDAVAQLKTFVATQPGAEARAELFTALVDRSNLERTAAIDRLRQVSRRLRALADAITAATQQQAALAPDAPDAQRAEIVDRRALLLRQYDELNRTVRYACEIPVNFEHRLGEFARILQPRNLQP